MENDNAFSLKPSIYNYKFIEEKSSDLKQSERYIFKIFNQVFVKIIDIYRI